MYNKRKTYALINSDNKIIKYLGKLQYFRVKGTALEEKNKIEKILKIKIGIRKLKTKTFK